MRPPTPGRESGFTLVEMMVVVLIIAILVAIAIPTFLGFRRAAQDRGSQVEVRTVLLAERAYRLEHGDYTGAPTDLLGYEPAAAVDPLDSALGVAAWLNASSADVVCLTRTSRSGSVFSVWESSTGGTYYGTADLSGPGSCPATPPAGFSAGGW